MLSEDTPAEPVEENNNTEVVAEEITDITADPTADPPAATETQPKPSPTAQIFCGNISYSSTEEAINEYFSKFGEISNILLAKKKQSEGAGHRGFAFISYADREIAEKVLQMNGHQLDGRDLTIKEAKPKTTKFFVGGLDRDKTDAQSLRSYFEQFGEIEDCFCPSGKKFGFVTMVESGDNIQRILEQGKFEIDGKSVDVKPAQPKKEERGGRDMGGYGNPMGGYGGGYGGAYGRPMGGYGGYGAQYAPYGGGRGGGNSGRGGGYGMYGRQRQY